MVRFAGPGVTESTACYGILHRIESFSSLIINLVCVTSNLVAFTKKPFFKNPNQLRDWKLNCESFYSGTIRSKAAQTDIRSFCSVAAAHADCHTSNSLWRLLTPSEIQWRTWKRRSDKYLSPNVLTCGRLSLLRGGETTLTIKTLQEDRR